MVNEIAARTNRDSLKISDSGEQRDQTETDRRKNKCRLRTVQVSGTKCILDFLKYPVSTRIW